MTNYDYWKLASPSDYENDCTQLDENDRCTICEETKDDCICNIHCEGCHRPNHACNCDEAYESQY